MHQMLTSGARRNGRTTFRNTKGENIMTNDETRKTGRLQRIAERIENKDTASLGQRIAHRVAAKGTDENESSKTQRIARHVTAGITDRSRGPAVKFMTNKGVLAVTRDGITGALGSGLHLRRTIPATEIASVRVGGADRQYLTAGRLAGATLSLGAALLAPSRIRGELVITTTSGNVLAFTLKRASAKQPEAVAAQFTAFGYMVI